MAHQSQTKALVYRSTIQPSLIRQSLRRRGLLAAFGAIGILFGGTCLTATQLRAWGIPIFFGGLTLIALGILPYKRLLRLQTKPHELHYDGMFLLFIQQGKPLFKIPEESIERVDYKEKESLYGMGILLKKPIEKKVKVLDAQFDYAAFTRHSQKHFEGADLFLPYFSKRTCQEVKELINRLESDHAS